MEAPLVGWSCGFKSKPGNLGEHQRCMVLTQSHIDCQLMSPRPRKEKEEHLIQMAWTLVSWVWQRTRTKIVCKSSISSLHMLHVCSFSFLNTYGLCQHFSEINEPLDKSNVQSPQCQRIDRDWFDRDLKLMGCDNAYYRG